MFYVGPVSRVGLGLTLIFKRKFNLLSLICLHHTGSLAFSQ